MLNSINDNSAVGFISYCDYTIDSYCDTLKRVAYIIRTIYDMGCRHFFVCSRTNFDKLIAEFLYSFKEENPDIIIEIISGCRFKLHLKRRSKITVVSNNYFKYDVISVEKYLSHKCSTILFYPNRALSILNFEEQNIIGKKFFDILYT